MSSLALCTRFLVVTGGSVTGRISRRMVAEAKLYVMMMLMVGMWWDYDLLRRENLWQDTRVADFGRCGGIRWVDAMMYSGRKECDTLWELEVHQDVMDDVMRWWRCRGSDQRFWMLRSIRCDECRRYWEAWILLDIWGQGYSAKNIYLKSKSSTSGHSRWKRGWRRVCRRFVPTGWLYRRWSLKIAQSPFTCRPWSIMTWLLQFIEDKVKMSWCWWWKCICFVKIDWGKDMQKKLNI